LIKTLYKKNNKNLEKLNFLKDIKRFLSVIWFFDDNYNLSNIKREKILPIKSINSQIWEDIETINNEFIKLVKNFLWNKNQQLIDNIYNIVWELLNNICHHSWVEDINSNSWDVIISANYQSWQFFDKKNFIQISIVDSWKWILASVRQKVSKIETAKEAIKKALQPWFTWWTTLQNSSKNFQWIYNAWIWLTTTLDIVKRLKWDLFIWTKDCLFCYNWKKDKEKFIKIPNWTWTFVVFNLYTDYNIEVSFSDIKNQLLWNNKDEIFDINFDLW
jgi:hypothetical protein